MLVNHLPSISSKSKFLSSSKNSAWWQRCCQWGLRWWRWFYWWLWGLLKVQLHSGQLLIRVITVSHSHCALCALCAGTPVASSISTVAVAVAPHLPPHAGSAQCGNHTIISITTVAYSINAVINPHHHSSKNVATLVEEFVSGGSIRAKAHVSSRVLYCLAL